MVFSSATPEPSLADTDFESDPGDVENFPTGANLSELPLFNNTPGGTNSQLLNGGYSGQVGVGKSFSVYPGDTLRIEAFAKYEGSNSTTPGGFASALLSAFSLPAPSPGEVGTASAALDMWGAMVDGGYQDNQGTSAPEAHINIVIFDRNYNFLDAAFLRVSTAAEQVGVTPDVDHEYLMTEYIVKEQGFVFMYVSNTSPVNVYFDDVTMAHASSNILQYNQYYPFGLRTENSWTREDHSNNFLYNGGSELNATTAWYETFFRGYDPALGRFHQVDPLAGLLPSYSPYNFALNNPANHNDPMGDYVEPVYLPEIPQGSMQFIYQNQGPGLMNATVQSYFGGPAIPEGGGSYSMSIVIFIRRLWMVAEGSGAMARPISTGTTRMYSTTSASKNITMLSTMALAGTATRREYALTDMNGLMVFGWLEGPSKGGREILRQITRYLCKQALVSMSI